MCYTVEPVLCLYATILFMLAGLLLDHYVTFCCFLGAEIIPTTILPGKKTEKNSLKELKTYHLFSTERCIFPKSFA